MDEIIKIFEMSPDAAVVVVEGVVCSVLGEMGFPVSRVKYKKKRKGLLRRRFRGVVDVTNVSGFLFAVSMGFVHKTGFRFDTRFSPAFCEEFDLAYFARSHGYKARVVLGLDRHYDHASGISSRPKEIRYLGRTIMSDELSERNMRLFCEKWQKDMLCLMKP